MNNNIKKRKLSDQISIRVMSPIADSISFDLKSFLIVALDVESPKQAREFVKILGEEVDYYKIGGSLYYNQGWEVIDFLKTREKKIFLDLKLYDIPNTVKNTCRQLAKLNIDMLTVHLSGGVSMLKAAKEGLAEILQPTAASPIDLLGVSVLTSFSEKEWTSLNSVPAIQDSIKKLCALAKSTLMVMCALLMKY